MNEKHIKKISQEMAVPKSGVKAVAELLEQDATIPFIARYRKEATGSLDEVKIAGIRDRLNSLKELDDRKETILNSLEKNGHLNDELRDKIDKAETMTVLEDIYLPYRPKRRTRAIIAKEKGLEPLALLIFEQKGISPAKEAEQYIDPEKEVNNVEDALAGAQDIIAEIVNEDGDARAAMRGLFLNSGILKSKAIQGKEEQGKKYKDYFEWQEPLKDAPSHRILAIRRGENEEILRFSVAPPDEDAISILEKIFIKGEGEDSALVRTAVEDGYKRLLSGSMETEARVVTKIKADAEAIEIFSENLRHLLLAPPLGSKIILGIDPGYRTGCKVVCLDRQGKLLRNDVIFPNMNEKNDSESESKLKELCEKYEIEAIAVGNGTAGRETEAFVRKIDFGRKIPVIMVNESGASVYSASEAARDEFPDLDLTVRGAVSIGRRLMDPLSELVKIDPKSIGVGQYQHDVDQGALKNALDDVVESCVNSVGVDVNRASAELLSYVSGLGRSIARNFLNFRNENGPFVNREDFKKVKGLGPKAFEQCAGFLRIPGGEVPLDASAVHPESYVIVDRMASDLKCTIADLIKDSELRQKIDVSKYVTEMTGLPTLNDIMNELAKPGRDPREEFQEFAFANGVNEIGDLAPGMELPGIVTNITAFGAFVDIGVHQDGLVHKSEMSDTYVEDPAKVLKVNQQVSVRILEVDKERKRISLSMKRKDAPVRKPSEKKAKVKETGRAGQAKKKRTAGNSKKKEIKPKPDKMSRTYNPFSDFFNKK